MKKEKKHRHSGGRILETELGAFRVCDICGKPYEGWKRKLANYWIKWKFYTTRGEAFIADINGLWNTIGGGAMGILAYKFVAENSKISLLILGSVWIFQKLLVLVLGYLDYHYWKIAQREGLYGFRFSPFAVEQLRRLKNIEKMVNPKDYKEESVVDYFEDKK